MPKYRRRPLIVCAFRWGLDPAPDWFKDVRMLWPGGSGYLTTGDYVLMDPLTGKAATMSAERFLQEYELYEVISDGTY